MNRECVGSFIRGKRKEKGLTQKQLGDMIGLSDRAVSRWENGIGLPDVEILLPLSEALGVTVDELLAGEEKRCLAISSQEDAATKVIRSFGLKRFLIFCLAGIITLCSCVLVMNRETVRYSDGSFYLVKQGGQYYPYFKVSDDIDCNSYLDTSLIPPSDTTASYDLYGMDITFGPGNCSKKYANLHELKRDTGISIDPVISRFSDSKCLVYMNQTNDSNRVINVVTRYDSGSRNNGVTANFSYIVSHSSVLLMPDDVVSIATNKRPSVRRLKCTNGDIFYILTFADDDRILAYHYSKSQGYICTLSFDTKSEDAVNDYLKSI